jgi:hypothetical protein
MFYQGAVSLTRTAQDNPLSNFFTYKNPQDITGQVEQHVHEIFRICCALNVEGNELHELNVLVERTSKFITVHLLISMLRLWQLKITSSS